MIGYVLLYIAAAVIVAWGVAHLVPTRTVVAGFAPISADNRRIFTMEWIAEGLTHIFIGVLILAVALLGSPGSRTAIGVYAATAGMLLAIAVLTALTGARTPVAWFKVCPVVLLTVVTLMLAGSIAAA